MKPGRTAMRHAADARFLLDRAARAAREAEAKAQTTEARKLAAHVRRVALVGRHHARELEKAVER